MVFSLKLDPKDSIQPKNDISLFIFSLCTGFCYGQLTID